MAKDVYHQLVKNLLQSNGWEITHDPLTVRGFARNIYIDLAAEKVFAAEREGRKIAVEVKSFLSPSILTDFYEAIGQYSLYLDALRQEEPMRKLFLALPMTAYEELATEPFVQNTLKRLEISLLVFNPEQKTIESWIV